MSESPWWSGRPSPRPGRRLLLDGPLGTELAARGVPTPLPLWSAAALDTHPGRVTEIHAAYAAAGATVHTANTFRTKRRTVGDRWPKLLEQAVRLCRSGIPSHHLLAGSISPLEDCYQPELSPADPRPEHREVAQALARMGCDILLCETFPHLGEGLIAVEEAAATGVETWVAFTAGPEGTLLSPEEVHKAAEGAVERGAQALLANCIAADLMLPYVQAIAGAGVPCGAYANAGHPDAGMGWCPAPQAPTRYLRFARSWVEAGATIIGGCCGTGPLHTDLLARAL